LFLRTSPPRFPIPSRKCSRTPSGTGLLHLPATVEFLTKYSSRPGFPVSGAGVLFCVGEPYPNMAVNPDQRRTVLVCRSVVSFDSISTIIASVTCKTFSSVAREAFPPLPVKDVVHPSRVTGFFVVDPARLESLRCPANEVLLATPSIMSRHRRPLSVVEDFKAGLVKCAPALPGNRIPTLLPTPSKGRAW